MVALLLAAAVASWVPARWNSADPDTLALIRQTPVNCILIEEGNWSAAFTARARTEGVATLGVLRPGGDPAASARRAAEIGFTGVVLEGDFPGPAGSGARELAVKSGLAVVELPPRSSVRLDSADPVIGTAQGVWPGINAGDDGSAKAAPTGGPWIDTNSGFLRFARASTGAEIWIGNLPPENAVIKVSRYLQAIGDAAILGARWILALDAGFEKRLFAGEASALEDWRRIGLHLGYWEERREWTRYRPYRGLAIIQDVTTGGLLCGGILDMISVRHTPIRSVPITKLGDQSIRGAAMAVNVDPSALSAEQKEALRRFTRGGGSLLSAPPGWKFPPMRPGQLAVDKQEIQRLDDIWRGVNSMIGRENLGVRLFNVSSMLSELVAGPGDRPVVLHLVNFADYPVEQVTVHLAEKVQRARLYSPGAAVKELEVYAQGEGSGVDIERIEHYASLVLE